ncbi:helix-turn-helix domain-containing protein [Echinicola pacifica]|nr:AraC family transcriptional regulator [Echinicola pacifica]
MKTKKKQGESGFWWHEEDPGPIRELPFIKQFGSMKFSKVRMDENMRPHLNDGIEIHYIESGKYDWVIEGRSIELLPDDLSITAPWHWNGSPAGKMEMGHINWLILKPEAYQQDTPLSLGPWCRIPVKYQEQLGKLIASEKGLVLKKAKSYKNYFADLQRELSCGLDGYEIKVCNILENLLMDLYRDLAYRKTKSQEDDLFIGHLTEMVFEDLTRKWIVDEMAADFGMGKTKFTEEVKRLTGYPPNSFIINLKIRKAKEMILSSVAYDLADIAFTCGFSSLQHFTTTFSQRTGISPGRFQSQARKKG